MAKRTPITIDLGDEVDRPIKFTASYADDLKKQYGSLKEMLGKVDTESTSVLPKLIFDGLTDKAGFTEASIRDVLDASLQMEIWLKILEALTGNKVEPANKRTIDPNSLAQTVQ